MITHKRGVRWANQHGRGALAVVHTFEAVPAGRMPPRHHEPSIALSHSADAAHAMHQRLHTHAHGLHGWMRHERRDGRRANQTLGAADRARLGTALKVALAAMHRR
jgi:hypothetical protein